jgi:hypothetical protein
LAPRCVTHNGYQLRLLAALAASRRRTATVTSVDTALAGACLAPALAGLTATAAITLGAASVVDTDRRSTKRDDGKGRPEEQTFHRRFSIPNGTELRDAMPQHATWASTSPPACRWAGRRRRLIQSRQTPNTMRGGRYGMASPAARANRVNSADAPSVSSETRTTAKWSGAWRSSAARPSAVVAESCRAFRWQWHGGAGFCSVGCGLHSGHCEPESGSADRRRWQQDWLADTEQHELPHAQPSGAGMNWPRTAANATRNLPKNSRDAVMAFASHNLHPDSRLLRPRQARFLCPAFAIQIAVTVKKQASRVV